MTLESSGAGTSHPELLPALDSAVTRGRHIAIVAAEGSGMEHLYAAAIVNDLAGDDATGGALVICPTPDRAYRCAAQMHGAVLEAGKTLTLAGEGTPLPPEPWDATDVLVGTPAWLLEQVRAGALPADAVGSVVLDDVRALDPSWAAVEAILQACDSDARRVASTHLLDETFEDVVKRWLPRPRRWPQELFDAASDDAPAATSGTAILAHTATAATTIQALLHDLAQSEAVGKVLVLVDEDDVLRTSADVALAGFDVCDPTDDVGVAVAPWGTDVASDAVVGVGLPADLETFRTGFDGIERRVAVVDPLHLRQLELLAQRAGWRVAVAAESADAGIEDEIEAFRAEVSTAIDDGDLGSSVLLLAPLFERHGAVRVAAALTEMLRRRPPAPAAEPVRAEAPPEPPRSPAAERVTSPAAERVTSPTWTKIFVGVGKKDGAGPGDLLGAITGETSIAAAQVGKIDIRQGHALVDVDSMVVDQVIRGLDGRQIKGRQVVARRDRDQR